jgi:hypothetical protein
MTDLLPHVLGFAGLLIGSLAYFAMIRRRAGERTWAAEERALQESGLRGLVRVLLADR